MLETISRPTSRRPGVAVTEARRVACVVPSHSGPNLCGRLIGRLYEPRTAAFVHLDAKAHLPPFRHGVANVVRVRFIERHVRMMWTDFSKAKSTLVSLKVAIASTIWACSHLLTISGAECSLVCNDETLASLADNPCCKLIRHIAEVESGDLRQRRRLRGIHFRKWEACFTPQRRPLYALSRCFTSFRAARWRLSPSHRDRAGSPLRAIPSSIALCDRALLNDCRPAFGPDQMFLLMLVENSAFAPEAAPIGPYWKFIKISASSHSGKMHALTPNLPMRTAAMAFLAGRRRKLFTRKSSSTASACAAALDWLDAAEEL